MIIKQDEPLEFVMRSISSVKDYVDGMYITVTYKETAPDDTNPIVKYLNEINAHVSLFKWVNDFSAARQFALDQVPKGVENYITWIDADDVMDNAPALRTLLDACVKNNISAMFFEYLYNVQLDEDGNIKEVLITHKRERIIRNDDTFKWVGMLHETLIEQRTENVIKQATKDFRVIHLSSPERYDNNVTRNIGILEAQAIKEEHKDPRTLIYLAKAYFDRGKMTDDKDKKKIDFDMALILFREYLNGFGKVGDPGYSEGSGWPEERASAWECVGEIAIITHIPQIAIQAFQEAINEAPYFPNYYIDLAMAYSISGDFKKAKHWLNLGTSIDIPDTTLISTPRDIKYRALEVDFQIAMREGKFSQAVEDAQQISDMFPENEDMQNRVQMARQAGYDNKAAQSIVFLGKYLESNNSPVEKLDHLVKAIPESLQQEKFASEMKHKFTAPREWKNNEIALICGPGFETWTPKSVNTGLGGSEEAVVYMSQELAKKGWKVTVYANPGTEAGNYDGVEYRMWHELNYRDKFNVLILWRVIGFVDFKPSAKFTMVWMHDVPNNPDFTSARVSMVNKIATLSEYHKGLLRLNTKDGFTEMPGNKVFLTANGVSIPAVDIEPVRNQKKIIYSSSIDRGLIYLLKMWPSIIEAVPKAELHVFYGFEVFDAVHKGNPGRMKWKEQMLEMMKQPGITYHGRVGHRELENQMRSAGIWAYPTDFTEISCITAMKAQCLGAIPVVTNFAALKETVRNGLKIDMDITTVEGQEEYKNQIIGLLKNNKKQKEIREPMIKWANDYFTWEKVASEWDKLFNVNLQNPDILEKKEV